MLAATFLLLGAGERRESGRASSRRQRSARRRRPRSPRKPRRAAREEIRREQQPGARESVQADVSARTVSVTSSFNGTEIVIFGAVDNSQQPSAESGYYDVVIVVEGVPGRWWRGARTTWPACG